MFGGGGGAPTSVGASENAAAGTIAGKGVVGNAASTGAGKTSISAEKSRGMFGARRKQAESMIASLMADVEAMTHPRRVAHSLGQMKLDYPDLEFDTTKFLSQIKDPKYRDQLSQYLR
jgi:hypothetical protein